MGCPTRIVPGFDASNKIKDPGLEMKFNQLLNKEKAYRKAQFNAGVITDSERKKAIKKERDRLASLHSKNLGDVEYRESNTSEVLRYLASEPGELGQMSRYLKNAGIQHSLRFKKGQGDKSFSRGGETQWTPVGITVDPEVLGDSNKFDNLYDLLVALGEDPKGPAAQYNNKLTNEQSIRMERAWIRKTGEDWQGRETTVEEFNEYL